MIEVKCLRCGRPFEAPPPGEGSIRLCPRCAGPRILLWRILVQAVIVGFVALAVVAVLLPALTAARRGARCAQEGTQTRGIHQGEIFFAQQNNRWCAGFDRNGKLDTDHVFDGEPQSTDWNGYDQSTPRAPAWRLRRLLENDYFTGEYCVSPSETKPFWSTGVSMDPDKFSYAMLKIEGEADSPRKQEHKETNNALAVVISDRLIRNSSGYRSVHTYPDDPNAIDWKGSVCWNDNHVTFEITFVLDTKYGDITNKDDNLFTESNPSGVPNAEAAMAWKSAGDTDAELVE